MGVQGLSAQQSVRGVAAKEAAEISLSTQQPSFTRCVEAYLDRSNKRTPEAERDKDLKRIANSLEHLIFHDMVSLLLILTSTILARMNLRRKI
ncbi:MAG: hypothetical protein M1839_001447 [Geoglossum umbratile]|nr:MAG: hypothetical protein M1839_001447 [Geoglossum umbratile]